MKFADINTKEIFGIDIGRSTIKVVQLVKVQNRTFVKAYGFGKFNPGAIKDGVIVNHEEIAKNIYTLIPKHVVGHIDSKSVTTAVPISSTFIRVLLLPKISKKELKDAVYLEAEQYIPTKLEDLYIDFEVIGEKEDLMEVLVVAAPMKIVDSYTKLFKILGLKLNAIETSMNSVARIIKHSEKVSDDGTIAIDIGPNISDLAIIDSTIRVTGSAPFGGDDVTKAIAKSLKITEKQADKLKKTEGINPGKNQKKIIAAIEPLLKNLTKEIQRMVRFYGNQSEGKQSIDEIILLGGSSNMPGLSTYLTDKLRIPTRLCNPWQNIEFDDLQPPHKNDMGIYATASGLALITSGEIIS